MSHRAFLVQNFHLISLEKQRKEAGCKFHTEACTPEERAERSVTARKIVALLLKLSGIIILGRMTDETTGIQIRTGSCRSPRGVVPTQQVGIL